MALQNRLYECADVTAVFLPQKIYNFFLNVDIKNNCVIGTQAAGNRAPAFIDILAQWVKGKNP